MSIKSRHIQPGLFILRNLRFYFRKNLLLSLGIAISTAVITGALIVGDSTEYSLRKMVSRRLGNAVYALNAGDRFFTHSLGEKLQEKLETPVAPVLMLKASAVAGGGTLRTNQINVLGIDENFDRLAPHPGLYKDLKGHDLVISRNLASRLSVEIGDELLLRITKASLIPLNAPFASDAGNIVAARFTIVAIAGIEQLAAFNLENSQTPAYNVFLSLHTLNELMELGNKANLLLFAGKEGLNESKINESIRSSWSLEDTGLRLLNPGNSGELQVSSERVFIEDATSSVLMNQEGLKYPILTYFVNSLSLRGHVTPYSFVSTLPGSSLDENEMVINQWLAEDLSASPGDTLKMKYFVMGPLRELSEEEHSFVVHSVVKMEGRFADPGLMPDLPGLSDAGNCRDWETGIPIDLGSIRPKDEKYWQEWKGTPKAFISLPKALSLWQNRFGNYTAFRYNAEPTDPGILERGILLQLQPSSLGFTLRNHLSEGDEAARNGISFSGLFGGLSFFLLAAGIMLSILLFILNLQFRKDQITTLSRMGIPARQIFRILFTEGILVGVAGALAGSFLAILYNQGIFEALNGVWKDIVRTDMMEVIIRPSTLLKGCVISLLVSAFALFFPLRAYLRQVLQAPIPGKGTGRKLSWAGLCRILFPVTGIPALLLIGFQLSKMEALNTGIFFLAGGLLLVSGIAASGIFILYRKERSNPDFRPFDLSLKNSLRNPARSMSIVILFALAGFVVVSTGSNRKDLFAGAGDPKGGTGGFLYYAESSVPVLHKLNQPEVRFQYGLSGEYSIVQFYKAEGDDASCLNLNRISSPEIIATDPANLQGRFSFVTKTPILDETDPWKVLEKELPDGLIPAIADETVIRWGLQMKTGDTLRYTDAAGRAMNLLLAGGLAPSVFQGRVIISESNFLKHFPQHSGTSVFLVDGNPSDSLSIMDELNMGLRDFGLEASPAAVRLAEFNSVTNTYLSVFMVLGALGLLLGTIGLGIVLFRSILERKSEIALLRALGLRKKMIISIIGREYFLLFSIGTGIGFFAAILATLPSILSPATGISFLTLLALLVLLMFNGWLWTRLMTGLALKNQSLYESLRND